MECILDLLSSVGDTFLQSKAAAQREGESKTEGDREEAFLHSQSH